MNVYTRTGGLYTLHHHMDHRRTNPHESTQLLDSSHCDELEARPPTIERLFQIYLTHRTTLLKRNRSSDTQVPLRTAENPPILQSPPKRPHATLQVNVNLSPHSPHTHTASHQRQLLHLVQRRAAPGGNLDSYYVRAIYAALDVSGVRGDGYEDGEELTCARVKN